MADSGRREDTEGGGGGGGGGSLGAGRDEVWRAPDVLALPPPTGLGALVQQQPPHVGQNVVQHSHQYPVAAGLIRHPSPPTMPVQVGFPAYVPPQYTVVPTPAALPPQQQHQHRENFQNWVPSNHNVAALHAPGAFQELRPMCSGSAFLHFGQNAASSNMFYQNTLPCSINSSWPNNNNMLRNPVYPSYHPHAAIDDHQAPPFHSNSHDTDQGFQTSFRMDQAFVPASSPFPPVSSSSHILSSSQISNGPKNAKKAKKSDVKDTPISFRRSDMKIQKNDELDQTPASEPPSLSQNSESLAVRFNCREYRVILRKELTNSDVGNIGRIVMPKRDAEAHLPALNQREGVMVKMDDFKIETTWNFKYRFWPNNKSRMYVLESTGGFVKHHGLTTGDILIIYKSSVSGEFVVRGEKAIKPNAVMPVVDCSCKNELNNSEECGFAISLQTKKT
uniref:TF-B3 domain-containing protein n=1 Tax=Oryza brachyantha TaxID=4533 RepID=J3M2M9_ORYBR